MRFFSGDAENNFAGTATVEKLKSYLVFVLYRITSTTLEPTDFLLRY